jgi:hypothetical protein
MHYLEKQRQTNNLTDLAEKYGESIDNLPMDVLMEAIYNGWYASVTSILDYKQSKETQKEKD